MLQENMEFFYQIKFKQSSIRKDNIKGYHSEVLYLVKESFFSPIFNFYMLTNTRSFKWSLNHLCFSTVFLTDELNQVLYMLILYYMIVKVDCTLASK